MRKSKTYNGNYCDIIQNFIFDKSFENFDTIILRITEDNINLNYIKDLLSVSSHVIKPGGNIIVISNNKFNDFNINKILSENCVWNKQHTIIYKTQEIFNSNLVSSYSYILWYSDNYRNSDPDPICNNIINNDVITDLWEDINTDIQLYEKIIKIFSNEGNTIFEPNVIDNKINIVCDKLNRNYIGINYEQK